MVNIISFGLCFGLLIAPGLRAEPEIVSVFPQGINKGTTFTLQVAGKGLKGVNAVWVSDSTLRTRIADLITSETKKKEAMGDKKREEVKTAKACDSTVTLQVAVNTSATARSYAFRLVSSQGVSNSLPLNLVDEPVVAETGAAHQNEPDAQLIPISSVVNGKVSRDGEVDLYAIDVKKDQTLLCEIDSSFGALDFGGEFDPLLQLFEPTGSWFDPQDMKRLVNADDPPKFVYTFPRDGRFILAVRSFVGVGGPHAIYQLRVRPTKNANIEGNVQDGRFARELKPDRLQELSKRTLLVAQKTDETRAGTSGTGADKKTAASVSNEKIDTATLTREIPRFKESEPNDKLEKSAELGITGIAEISVPGIVEGTIGRPGDVDYFKFKVKPGQTSLAFEMEMPDLQPFEFNPKLTVLDAAGQEVITNMFKRVGGDGDDWIQTIEPKTLFTFDAPGEYYLQIRDLTYRFGNERFKYRVLIRPQVPHIGNIEIADDHINLAPGGVKKLTINAQQEEGFSGDVAILFDNLPKGVEAVPAAEVEGPKGTPFETIHEERFVPKTQKVNVMLMARPDAPPMSFPQFAKVKVRVVAEGKVGEAFQVKEFPIMVTK